MGVARPDHARLGIDCPECGRTLSSRALYQSGLRCSDSCAVSLRALSEECNRRWGTLTYLFEEIASGEVKYVGTTMNLNQRLRKHCYDGKLKFGREVTDNGGKEDARATPQKITATIANSGMRIRVALHANERYMWDAHHTVERGRVHPPEENAISPPKGELFRSVQLSSTGETDVVEFDPARCRHRLAEALSLHWSSRGGKMWTNKTPRVNDVMLGETSAMVDVGRLSVSSDVMIDDRTQQDWFRWWRQNTTRSSSWRVLRQGACEKQEFYGYCRCRVPCGQRWLLVGEPEPRRQLREETRYTRSEDPWRQHAVMGADDETIADKVEMAEECQGKLRRAECAKANRMLLDLTKEITALREIDFYGQDSVPAPEDYGDGTMISSQIIQGLDTRPVYLRDRRVWRR